MTIHAKRGCACLLVLAALLLGGCGLFAKSASAGDLHTKTDAVSVGDLAPDTRPVLSANGGLWRSEQTTADDALAVRELTLAADGSFQYREGDADSEFSYFAEGKWTLDGARLNFTITQTDEGGQPLAAPFSAGYRVTLADGVLCLTLADAAGFCADAEGQSIYYYQPG